MTASPSPGRHGPSSRLRGLIRLLLIVLAGGVGIPAVPGGVSLLAGFYAPPVEQLAGSGFTDFTVPGLALLFLVGGSALLAGVLLLRRRRFALHSATLAGLVVMSFEFVEVLAIGSPPGPPRAMQILFFTLGAGLVAVSLVALVIDLRWPPQGSAAE